MEFKKLWPSAIVGSFVVIFLILLFTVKNQSNTENLKKMAEVNISGQTLKVEVVSSAADMYQGLSGRKNLCSNCGMLFAFSDLEPRSFVMRNMLIPLDIVFVSDDVIVQIYKNLAPEGANTKNIYESIVPANYVLEINAGKTDELNLKVGDKLEL
ncbi:MAG: DUF192 domain-containing protein [Patescibacteria group bacterium]